MKICFAIPSFNFFLSHRLELIERISDFHQVTVLTDIDEANLDLVNSLKNKSFAIKHTPRRKKGGIPSFFSCMFALKKAIDNERPNQVFFITIEQSIIGALISRYSTNYKSNFVFSGFWPFFSFHSIKFRILDFLVGIIFKFIAKKENSTFIFQNSDHQKLFIEKKYIDIDRSKVIFGNGINIPEAPFSISDHKNLIRFCFVGRLAKSKGLEDFIDAIDIIEKNKFKVSVLIAGYRDEGNLDYFDSSFYKKIKEKNSIVFLEEIEHSKILSIYKPGDVFVLPSYSEGLPKAALEAASISIPLILTNISGCRECIDGNGYLVKKENPDDLAKKMLKFIEDPNSVITLGHASKKIVQNKFSIKQIASKYLKLIDSI
ncbi:glycosyltransferase [Gammaproteobacteria bacterium]|nr:glycosyltransferase [Gammaproteobacteria bacterium]